MYVRLVRVMIESGGLLCGSSRAHELLLYYIACCRQTEEDSQLPNLLHCIALHCIASFAFSAGRNTDFIGTFMQTERRTGQWQRGGEVLGWFCVLSFRKRHVHVRTDIPVDRQD